jgi:hypothetical protein
MQIILSPSLNARGSIIHHSDKIMLKFCCLA